ncbi:putative lipoprotein [Burkholderia cepacia]|nr:putative lipoprotein [Burkholderia cepacia]
MCRHRRDQCPFGVSAFVTGCEQSFDTGPRQQKTSHDKPDSIPYSTGISRQ